MSLLFAVMGLCSGCECPVHCYPHDAAGVLWNALGHSLLLWIQSQFMHWENLQSNLNWMISIYALGKLINWMITSLSPGSPFRRDSLGMRLDDHWTLQKWSGHAQLLLFSMEACGFTCDPVIVAPKNRYMHALLLLCMGVLNMQHWKRLGTHTLHNYSGCDGYTSKRQKQCLYPEALPTQCHLLIAGTMHMHH